MNKTNIKRSPFDILVERMISNKTNMTHIKDSNIEILNRIGA